MDYIIVGLGNPGKKYENTRHNSGFIVMDKLSQILNVSVTKYKFKSLAGECTISGNKCLVLKPDTFMNLSGQAVVEAMTFYKIPPENVIVVFDDISLDVGKMRIRQKGSDGGQNGMKNIIYLSGSQNFPRIKVGIGKKPHPDYNLADWVLSSFDNKETLLIDEVAKNAVNAIELIVSGKTDRAMNLYNS